MSNTLPIKFEVGNGGIIVSPRFNDGVLSINITRNSTDMTFNNGHMLTSNEAQRCREQIEQIPDAVFEFTDIDLGIQFYKGVFKNPNQQVIDTIYSRYLMWHLAICC